MYPLSPYALQVHVGTENCTDLMLPYIFKRNREGIHIINIAKSWEKLMIAARVIAAIPNPQDVLVSLPQLLEAKILKLPVRLLRQAWGAFRSFPTETTLREPC